MKTTSDQKNPKVILITGASKGIGCVAAGELAARGAQVVITSRDSRSACEAAEKIGCDWLQLDVTEESSVREAGVAMKSRYGRLDVLVNNAAIVLDVNVKLMDLKPEVLRATLETNLIGTLRVTQAMAPLLEFSDDPRIINISSVGGQLEGVENAVSPAYNISKTAVNMLTRQITAAIPRVTCNSMCPGWCRTEMGGPDAPRSAKEGADTLIWLAMDAPKTLREKFVKDRAVIPW